MNIAHSNQLGVGNRNSFVNQPVLFGYGSVFISSYSIVNERDKMCAVPMTLSWPTTFPNLLSMHLCNSNDGLSDRCSESCHRDYWDLAIRLPRFHANLLLQDDACTDNKSPIGAKSDGHGSQRDVIALSVCSLQICESISGIKLHLDKPSSLPPPPVLVIHFAFSCALVQCVMSCCNALLYISQNCC